MGTLTSLMHLSQSALANASAAMDVVANNISNQGVDGYSRRTVQFSSQDTYRIDGVAYGTGASVQVTAQRDRVLDARVQQATQASSAASARSSALTALDTLFSLSSDTGSDATGISTALSSLASAFNTLASSGGSTTNRQSAINALQTFTDSISQAASQIQSLQSSTDQQVGDTLTTVNSLLAQVTSLNTQIASSPDADALIDQRTSVLNQLSRYISFQQVSTDNNGITVVASDGTTLASSAASVQLSATTLADGLHITTSSGNDVSRAITGGSVGGLLTFRNQDLQTAMDGLDAIAYNVSYAINTANSGGVRADGTAGADLLNNGDQQSGAALALSLVSTDPASLALASTTEGTSGTSNATALGSAVSSSLVDGQTPSSFIATFLASLGDTIATVSSAVTTTASILTQTQTQRDAFSAVSLDEEAASLTQYQRSYQAAAKVFSIADTIFAAAINLGTETAVS